MSETLSCSVVVPFLNEESLLPACIHALENQTIDRIRFEQIFVDNGSTDASVEIVGREPNIRLLHESVRDPYLARNRGIAAANANYIVFLDADCIPDNDWLERLNDHFNGDVDILLGYVGYPAKASVFVRCYEDYYHCKLKHLTERGLLDNLFGHGGNMAVRADVFRDLGLFEPMPVAGDTEIIHRLFRHRPQAVIRYVESAHVRHAEVTTFGQVLRKLYDCGGYSETLSRMNVCRPIPLNEKWHIVWMCMTTMQYGFRKIAALLVTLSIGWMSYLAGRIVRNRRMTAWKMRIGGGRAMQPAGKQGVSAKGGDARD